MMMPVDRCCYKKNEWLSTTRKKSDGCKPFGMCGVKAFDEKWAYVNW
jgi:hypothetical protein